MIFATAIDSFVEVLGIFGVKWQLLLIQAINFLCILSVLYFFAFRPILKTMEERRTKIESGLKYAEEMKEQLAKSDITIKAQLAKARDEARQIIEEAQQQAQEYAEKQKAEIEQLTQNMVATAKQNIADERTKMLANLKGEVKLLVVDITSKVLAKELSLQERTRYLSETEIQF